MDINKYTVVCAGCGICLVAPGNLDPFYCKSCRIIKLEAALTKILAVYPKSETPEQTAAKIEAYRALGIDIPDYAS